MAVFYKYEYRGIMKNIHPWKGGAASSGESMLLLLLLVMLALLVEEIVKVRQHGQMWRGFCGTPEPVVIAPLCQLDNNRSWQ